MLFEFEHTRSTMTRETMGYVEATVFRRSYLTSLREMQAAVCEM